MRLVIQRVKEAQVRKVETGKIVGQIGPGLFVLLGLKKGDSEKEADYLSEKLIKLRIMSDRQDKMNLSIKDIRGEILIVSQFTLYGETKGQNRPSFIQAEEPEKAKVLYEYFVNKLKEKGVEVKTGSFGDYMEIEAILDGPVTTTLEN